MIWRLWHDFNNGSSYFVPLLHFLCAQSVYCYSRYKTNNTLNNKRAPHPIQETCFLYV